MTACAFPRTGDCTNAVRPHVASALQCPSALSLEFCAPAPPVSTLTTSDCLAGPSPDFRADFRHRVPRLLLRPLSQTSGIEALRRPSEAPETIPAPEALPALSMLFVSLFTSLSDITRRDCGCVRGSSEPALFASRIIAPIAAQSFSVISGDRMEKRPPTPQPKSFTVRHRLQRNSLASPSHSAAGLSWLSFSPSGDLLPIAGRVTSGSACYQARSSPRQPG